MFVRKEYTNPKQERKHKLSPVATGPFEVVDFNADTVVVKDGDTRERISRDRVVAAPNPHGRMPQTGTADAAEPEAATPDAPAISPNGSDTTSTASSIGNAIGEPIEPGVFSRFRGRRGTPRARSQQPVSPEQADTSPRDTSVDVPSALRRLDPANSADAETEEEPAPQAIDSSTHTRYVAQLPPELGYDVQLHHPLRAGPLTALSTKDQETDQADAEDLVPARNTRQGSQPAHLGMPVAPSRTTDVKTTTPFWDRQMMTKCTPAWWCHNSMLWTESSVTGTRRTESFFIGYCGTATPSVSPHGSPLLTCRVAR